MHDNAVIEKELLHRISKGDQFAYKILFEQYWDQVYSIAFMFTKSAELAEDIAQDVFAAIWVKRAKLQQVEKFKSWLFITARNTLFDRLRKKVFTGEYDDYYLEYFADSSPSPETQVELKDFEKRIRSVIQSLPAQQQTAFKLSRFQGLSHEEVARQMGLAKETVKSHISRSILTLRRLMAEQGEVMLFIILVAIEQTVE